MAKQFNGVINLDVRDSVADWGPFQAPEAPEGAPNVLIVLYDDNDTWQLFHTDEDRSEAHDLADQHPDRVRDFAAAMARD